MKLLWTLSNWKHTGPVQPSLDLAAGVRDRGHGVRVAVGVPPARYAPEAEVLADERGLARAGVGTLLHKHAFFLRDVRDRRRLARWLLRERPDAIVTTLPNDHRLAAGVARRLGGPPVVRLYFGDAGAPAPRDARALRDADAVVAFAAAPVDALRAAGVPAARIRVLGMPLDVRGLRRRVPGRREARARRGVAEERFLVGIVARLQRHRRFSLLWEAMAEVVSRGAAVTLLVLGRGTWQEEVAREPVRRLGLEEHVRFAGYRLGRDYAQTVAGLDAQVLLVPGSDPTCRALREGMALGVPSLATRRGLLGEIVDDGRTGLLVDETPASLARAIRSLAGDREAAGRMGEAAARKAEREYDATRVAADLLALLEERT